MNNWLEAKIDRFQKWNRRRKYVRGIYFNIKDAYNGLFSIQLLRGKFKGVTVAVSDIKFVDDGHAKLDLRLMLSSQPIALSQQNMLSDPVLNDIINDIFLICYEDATENYSTVRQEVLNDEEVGNDYIEELTEQRTVLPKGNAVSKARVLPGKTRKSGVRRNTKPRTKVQSKAE